ncbi:Fructokinase-like 1, chloroplastic [Ananas comosus]|uniref:Fructokinase-like 1, chloroplastic n=1 Tax=Ananas comosus TaxID=4615 RepID=A0A199VKD0_ANACO|nr:Fructokinase-like 1, chloroplastic [Ananas comosus]
MASLHTCNSFPFPLPLPSLRTRIYDPKPCRSLLLLPSKPLRIQSSKASINGESEAPAPPKPTRRGRKKSSTADTVPSSPSPAKRTRRSKKNPQEPEEPKAERSKEGKEEGDDDEFDDGIDFPYESPPLICCFGAAQREFVPTVRISKRQMHPDQYSSWKQLQWSPPEFARAPGGSPSNVAVSHVRLGGRAAFMGKVGDDDLGNDLVYRMNLEKVQTRAVKIDKNVKTAASYMRLGFRDQEDGKGKRLVAETVKGCAEDSFVKSDVDVAVLKEARILHFNSEVLLTSSMHPPLFRAIQLSKKFGSKVFFDLNLPLPLWKSKEETWEVIKKAWNEAEIIEVSRQELEFLLDEEYYEKKRNYTPQYYAESYEQTKRMRDYYHYLREEIAPLWNDKIKILFVTDGTLRIHYYTPKFDGAVVGTEDVLITPFTCDRTGSGDAVAAAIIRKLTTHLDMYEDQDILERQLRFAVAAGIISQWTIGAVRGFPTESATQNLKEQVYVPSMW